MVGGYPIPEVNRLMNAFMEGARSVNPDVKFMVSFIGSWYDPPKAKEAAFAMIDAGADVMYAERFGVSDAAKERGVLAIGNVIDTAADYPGTVVASALWHMEPTIDRAIEAVKAGEFKAEDYGVYSYMEHGGGSLAPLDPALVPQEVIDAVKAKEEEIKSGAFKVEVNDAEPQASM
jgi:basic membrane lipoprotein Med (substrate-binding protein (PBP1-ABC) superfamily)